MPVWARENAQELSCIDWGCTSALIYLRFQLEADANLHYYIPGSKCKLISSHVAAAELHGEGRAEDGGAYQVVPGGSV